MEWNDDYLNWESINDTDFHKLFTVQVPKLYLWAPEMLVWNSANENRLLKMKNDTILTVDHGGKVSGQISTLLNTQCEMHVQRYEMQFHKIKVELKQGL